MLTQIPPHTPRTSGGGEDSVLLLLRNSLNEFFLMSAFFPFSPPCLPTDILSFNSSVARQEWRERGREWEGEGMDGERKKESLFQHQKTVFGDGGIHWLFHVLFDDAFSVLWTQWYTTAAAVYLANFSLYCSRPLFPHQQSVYYLFSGMSALMSLMITCLLFWKTHFLAWAGGTVTHCKTKGKILVAHASCNKSVNSPNVINSSRRCHQHIPRSLNI